jgi:hypothetical protein
MEEPFFSEKTVNEMLFLFVLDLQSCTYYILCIISVLVWCKFNENIHLIWMHS